MTKITILLKKEAKIIVALILTVVLIASGYALYLKVDAMSSPALKMTISTNFSELGTPQVSNITFEQTTVPFIYKKGHSEVTFPDISVNAKTNNIEAGPISYWAATPRPDDEGVYELTVLFMEGKEPKTDDMLLLPVRLTNFRGNIIYKTTAFYEWD
ncbi:MAG: hypothetical protein P1P72_05260 [ANME-2 cluster archaeon]|nr:hypothetical protein [ANME-2 cluster archaeon]